MTELTICLSNHNKRTKMVPGSIRSCWYQRFAQHTESTKGRAMSISLDHDGPTLKVDSATINTNYVIYEIIDLTYNVKYLTYTIGCSSYDNTTFENFYYVSNGVFVWGPIMLPTYRNSYLLNIENIKGEAAYRVHDMH